MEKYFKEGGKVQRVRRLWLLLAIYLLGAFTYSISLEVLLIIVVPLSFILLMYHDEASYKKNIIKNKKSSSAVTLED